MSWISLNEANTRLQKEYPELFSSQALDITEAAVRSGQPFLRGLGRSHIPELIGDQINTHDHVSVVGSEIRDARSFTRWWVVEAHWERFIVYVEENLLPAWISTKPAKRNQPQPQPRGPTPNSFGLGKSDAELFPEMERRMRAYNISVNEAARGLVEEGIAKKRGGNVESATRRLAERYRKARRAAEDEAALASKIAPVGQMTNVKSGGANAPRAGKVTGRDGKPYTAKRP